jgi:uncharacterized protein (DUF58 family)
VTKAVPTQDRQDKQRRVVPRFVLAMMAATAAVIAQSDRLPLVAVVFLGVGVAAVFSLGGRSPELRVGTRFATASSWYVGDTVRVGVHVENIGRSTTAMTTVLPVSPGLALTSVTVPELRGGESVVVSQRTLLLARRPPAPVALTVRLHHRLVGSGTKVVAHLGTEGPLPAVRPRPLPPPAAIVERMSRPSDEGLGTGRRGNADLLALRPFATGDPVSSVHWRSTARAGYPVVMEREQLVSGVLVLLVASTGSGEAWERAVARAAGLVQAADHADVPVEVVTAPPAGQLRNGATAEEVQLWLAGLGAAGAAEPELVALAVRRASSGLVAVLTAEPWLAGSVVEAGAPAGSVVDLMTAPW